MGAREMTSKESAAARRRTIFLLIVYVHVVTSQHSGDEAPAPPCPPSPPQLPYSSRNSCPDNPITQILDPAISCTPPPHDGGDLSPVTCMTSDEEPIRSATFAELVVKSLSSSRKDEGTQWEIIFELIYPAAVCLLFFSEIPLRILYVLLILFVNAVMAILLPAEWLWVPAVSFASYLLTLIIAFWLP